MIRGKNGGGGNYYLYSGDVNSVSIPQGSQYILRNHTHPNSTLLPSQFDTQYMFEQKLNGSKQNTSVILPANGSTPVKFNIKTPAVHIDGSVKPIEIGVIPRFKF